MLILFTLAVPSPASVIIAADPSLPVSNGTEVTLTCTVELSPALADFSSLAVTVIWTGPPGMLSGSNPIKMANSPPTYTSILTLATVESSGSFTCQAQVDSSSLFITASQTISTLITVPIVGKL